MMEVEMLRGGHSQDVLGVEANLPANGLEMMEGRKGGEKNRHQE